jgi:acyl-CoA synthetase (AMP-forming)/AMP-acid ligase II
MQHEAVAEVAVIGVCSHKWGETPLALIVAEAGNTLEERTIVEWCNVKLGKQQRIAGARILESLPRNPNGKILKRELRQQFEQLVY